jgi:hypothetical protein
MAQEDDGVALVLASFIRRPYSLKPVGYQKGHVTEWAEEGRPGPVT